MDFDDLIVERPATAGAPADEPDRHFYEGAVMLAYAMHLLRTEPVREVKIHPDGQHARQVDFPGWLGKRGFRRAGSFAYGGGPRGFVIDGLTEFLFDEFQEIENEGGEFGSSAGYHDLPCFGRSPTV